MADARAPTGWSIRTKGVTLAATYLLAFAAVYVAFTLYLVRRETAQATERFQQTASIVAAEVDAFVASGAQRLDFVTKLPGLAYGLQTIQEAHGSGNYIPPWTTLHYLFFKSRVFTGGVFLLDRSGRVMWTEPPGLSWLHRSFGELVPIAEVRQTHRAAVSGVLSPDDVLDAPHAIVAVPIGDDRGDLQGVLGGVIDLTSSDLGVILAAVSTAAGRFVEIVDQHGIVLVSTEPSRRFGPAELSSTRGEAQMLASAKLVHAPWRVIAGQPASAGLAGVRQIRNALWGIGIILVIVAAAIALPLMNSFVRALKRLTDAAEIMRRGDLTQPVPGAGRGDELATLSQAFEQMRVELGRSRAALEQRLEEREDLVQLLMRTNHELQTAQARLIDAERFAAIGELSVAIAHGIRNPVAGIKLAAQLLLGELPAEHPFRANIRDVIDETDKLEAQIKTLLDFSRPFEPNPAPDRIERIVTKAVGYLRSRAASHGVEIVVDVPQSLPEAHFDNAHMEQVLLALLSNALEATTAGGRVTVRARVAEDERHLLLEVIDTGSGIPPQNLPRVFDLFFTTKSSGTGLGLAVARKIVERHGGVIEVDSRPGRGARFSVLLPLAGPPPTGREGTAPGAWNTR